MDLSINSAGAYAIEAGQKAKCFLGLNRYQVFYETWTNPEISITDIPAAVVDVATRLTIADGYSVNAPNDGYLNPTVRWSNGSIALQSNASFLTDTITLGPLCFPYVDPLGNHRGIEPTTTFQPTGPQQVYFHIFGPSLSPNGNYYKLQEVRVSTMHAISYKLILQAVGSIPGAIG